MTDNEVPDRSPAEQLDTFWEERFNAQDPNTSIEPTIRDRKYSPELKIPQVEEEVTLVTDANLCTACWTFVSDVGRTVALKESAEFPNYRWTCEAAKLGCRMCSVVMHSRWTVTSSTQDLIESRRLRFSDVSEGPESVTVSLTMRDSDRDREQLGGKVAYSLSLNGGAASDRPGAMRWGLELVLIPYEKVPDFTGSKDDPKRVIDAIYAAQLIEKWIQACGAKHTRCHTNSKSTGANSELPTRLIEVTARGGVTFARLQETAALPPGGQYVTLSHCWGKIKSFTLVNDNIEALKQSIPLARLTRTFQDAIELTRQLKISYIWIDSLCIIQDSKEDWERECGTMTAVYRNSYLNIAATGANDGSGGLFGPRQWLYEPHAFGPIVIPQDEFQDSKSQKEDVVLTQGEPSSKSLQYALLESWWDIDIDHSPLLARAWVYQECALARRVVHFTAAQIYWECFDTIAAELFPDRLPACIKAETGLPRLSARPLQLPAEGILSSWSILLWQYAGKGLTVKTDRLIAVAGLAKAFEPHFPGKYLAGLWEYQLYKQLVWHVRRRAISGPDPAPTSTALAPSWSWACTELPILQPIIHKKDFTPLVELIDHDLKPSTTDSFGHIGSGSLLLAGSILRGVFPHPDYERVMPVEMDPPAHRRIANIGQNVTCFAYLPNGRFLAMSPEIWIDYMSETCGPFESDQRRNVIRQLGSRQFCMLPVASRPIDTDDGAWGLLLQRTGNKGEYVRRGLWRSKNAHLIAKLPPVVDDEWIVGWMERNEAEEERPRTIVRLV